MLKKTFLLLSLVFPLGAQANTFHSFVDVLSLMKQYVSTITCDELSNDDMRVFEVFEYNNRTEAYGVVWHGDRSCGDVDGARSIYVTPVVVTRENQLVVASEGESKLPYGNFKQATQTDKQLMISVYDHKESDPICCPTGSKEYFVDYDAFQQKFVYQD